MSSAAKITSLKKTIRSKGDTFGRDAAVVENLRLTNELHEALKSTARGPQLAQVYLDLGDTYDYLSGVGFWDLPEIYYEACIRESPKSTLSQNCFRELERVTIIQYSGTAGMFLPEEERARLKELKNLSGIK